MTLERSNIIRKPSQSSLNSIQHDTQVVALSHSHTAPAAPRTETISLDTITQGLIDLKSSSDSVYVCAVVQIRTFTPEDPFQKTVRGINDPLGKVVLKNDPVQNLPISADPVIDPSSMIEVENHFKTLLGMHLSPPGTNELPVALDVHFERSQNIDGKDVRILDAGQIAILAGALALALPKGCGAKRAADALARLSQIDLLSQIRDPSPVSDEEKTSINDAWQIAQELTDSAISGGEGFSILKKLIPRPSTLRPDPGKHDDNALRIFLIAGKYKCKESPGLEANPFSIYANGAIAAAIEAANPSWPGKDGSAMPKIPKASGKLSLLDKGLLAIRDHLEQSAHAMSETPFKPQKNGCSWAMAAIDNGFYTDNKIDATGNKTLFETVNSRMVKLYTKVEQETVGNTHPKWTRFLRLVAPSENKAIFSGLDRVGGWKNGHPVPGKTGLDHSNLGGVSQARAMKEGIIMPLENGLKHALSQTASKNFGKGCMAENPPEDVLRKMVRLAILEQHREETPRLTHFQCLLALNPKYEIKDAKEKLFSWMENGENGQSQKTKELINRLFVEENIHPTPEGLLNWAGTLGGAPRDLETAIFMSHSNAESLRMDNEPDWIKFCHSLDFVLNGRLPNPPIHVGKIHELSALEAASLFQISHDELGSSETISSNSNRGLNTGTWTEIVSGAFIAAHVPVATSVRGKVDIQANRGRAGTTTVAVSTAGAMFSYRSETANSGGIILGVGYGPGWKLDDITIGIQASGDIGASSAWQYRVGFTIIKPRPNGVAGDKDNNAEFAVLVEKVLAPNGRVDDPAYPELADPEDRDCPLKRLFQHFDGISVVADNAREKDINVNAKLGFGAGVTSSKVNHFGLLPASLKGQVIYRNEETYTVNGATQIKSRTTGWSGTANASLELANFYGSISDYANSDGLAGSLGTPTLDTFAKSAQFLKVGETTKITEIYENGNFLKKSFKTVECDPLRFYLKVLPNLLQIAEEKAAKYAPRYYKNIDAEIERRLNLELHADKNEHASSSQAGTMQIPGDRSDINPGNAAYAQNLQNERRESIKAEILDERKHAFDKELTCLQHSLFTTFQNLSGNDTLALYYEPKDEVVLEVNRLSANIKQANALGDEAYATELEKKIKELLDNENSWEHSFEITSNTRENVLKTGMQSNMLDEHVKTVYANHH